MSPRVLVSRPIPDPALQRLAAVVDLEVAGTDGPLSAASLADKAADKHGLICLLHDRIDAALLDHAPHLRIVANMAVGFDNIDVTAATARRVLVTNTPGVLTDATADLAFALILAVARQIVPADRLVRAGRFERWEPMAFLGVDLAAKTIGIIGMGRIGQAVARRAARGFAMRVVYWSRRAVPEVEAELGAERRADLGQLLAESHFVSVHLPLSATTRGLLDEAALAAMRPDAILVNTSRGAIIDEAALVAALASRRLAGAGLDVYQNEPELAAGLRELDNAVLLPHIGSATIETRGRMADLAVTNLLAGLSGKRPPALLNPDAFSAPPSA